jgi:L-threonate 2-dehydrogenase
MRVPHPYFAAQNRYNVHSECVTQAGHLDVAGTKVMAERTPNVAIVAVGEMGQGVGRLLRERGAHVITCLQGRSAQTAKRAKDAGILAVPDDDTLVCAADIVLSIVPPGEAVALSKRTAAAMLRTDCHPPHIDCNADIIACAGAPVADVGIIGPPPGKGRATKFYASGPPCPSLDRLTDCGLDVRWVSSAVGDASTLKMCYGGLTKGLTALGTTLMVSAKRAGIDQALAAELADSQAEMLAFLDRFISSMPPKAYRWVAEMEEGAATLERAGLPGDMLRGAAELYEWIAKTPVGRGASAGTRIAVIEGLAEHPNEKHRVPAATK